MCSSSKLFLFSAFFVFLLLVSNPWVSAASEGNATLAITQAEEKVSSAYEAVLEAEQVGANVSELVDRLNVAVGHLADAQMLFRSGDFDGAIHSADLANIGVDIKTDAEQLKVDTQSSWNASLLSRLIVPIVGVTVVSLATFIAWRGFKQRYFREALEI